MDWDTLDSQITKVMLELKALRLYSDMQLPGDTLDEIIALQDELANW